jgi:hypothetical protein
VGNRRQKIRQRVSRPREANGTGLMPAFEPFMSYALITMKLQPPWRSDKRLRR